MVDEIIVISSALPGAGKTHFAAGLGRWLHGLGRRVAPLHLSAPVGDPVACPEGGCVSRACALLAEACGLAPSVEYESGWDALGSLRERFDCVIVENRAGQYVQGDWRTLALRRSEGVIVPEGFSPLPEFVPDLMPVVDAELAALPVWSFGKGPRAGVVSLPHIANFGDYQLARGAEWLVGPAPGQFGVIFIPATSNAEADFKWMRETGLIEWLAAQRGSGCRAVASGWSPEGCESVPEGALDYRRLSLILGRRLAPPMPDEETLDRLARWFADWPDRERLVRAFLPGLE